METSWRNREPAAQRAAVQALGARQGSRGCRCGGNSATGAGHERGKVNYPASVARDSPGSCRWMQRVRNKLQLRESPNEQLLTWRDAGDKEIVILI